MATKGTKARLYFDQYDFSGETSQIAVNFETPEGESTNLASEGREYEPMLPTMSIEQNGYIVDAGSDGTLEKELYDRLAANSSIVAALFGIDDTNCPAYVQDAGGAQGMMLDFPVAGLMTLRGAWAKGRGGYRGIRVFTGAVTATGVAGTVCDLGAAGVNGGTAFIFVQSITGAASGAAVKLQHATSSGGTYADLATFTFSAVGASKQTYSGSVRRYLRVNVSALGGATGFTFVVIACSNGVTM
jgi:hypothetical protein